MKQYLDLAKQILTSEESVIKEDGRNGTTISRFGAQMRFDLQKGFPALTTKKLHFKSIIHENIWFLNGDTNIKYLQDNGVRIWNEWADENGNLGRVYGAQWTDWTNPKGENINQVKKTIEDLINKPFSRRHIVTAWNPAEVDEMALPPCNMMYQFNVREVKSEKFLDLQLYQRSADYFLDVPFNIAGYAILTHMYAQVTNMKPGHLVHTLGDHHFYIVNKKRGEFYKHNLIDLQKNIRSANDPKTYLEIKDWIEKSVPSEKINDHIPLILEQMSREPRELPQLYLNPKIKKINEFKFEDFEIKNYKPHKIIKREVTA